MTDQSSSRRPAPFSLRLTPEERSRLESDAAGMAMGAYIRWRLFDPDSPAPRHRNKAPVRDHQALSAVLSKLGQSRIASNLNQLARAAHVGALPVTPDVEAELREAARHVTEMRHLLISALGMSDGAP